MSRPHFPPDDATDYRDIIRRLEALERSGGAPSPLNGTTLVAASASTASSSFVDWPGGTAEVTFRKRQLNTVLQLTYWTTFFATATAGGFTTAFKNMDTATDHAIGVNHFINTLSQHQFFGGVVTPSDSDPGVYTYRFRVRVSVNAATFNVDSNDYVQVSIQERLLTAS